MKNKIIFLDIDGVLNSTLYDRRTFAKCWTDEEIKHHCPDIDKKAIELLNQLDNCKIVISSSWRYFMDETVESLIYNGLKLPIIGKTPEWYELKYGHSFDASEEDIERYLDEQIHGGDHRGVEIQHYINNHNDEIDNYIIIDDIDETLNEQKEHFIKTNSFYGLTQDDIEKIKIILKLI